MESLRTLEGRAGRVSAATVSLKVVTGRWRRLVLANPQLGEDELDRRAYAFSTLETLQAALNRRDVFVPRSGSPIRERSCSTAPHGTQPVRRSAPAGLDPAPQRALEHLCVQLDSAYRQTAEQLDGNLALEIAEIAGARPASPSSRRSITRTADCAPRDDHGNAARSCRVLRTAPGSVSLERLR